MLMTANKKWTRLGWVMQRLVHHCITDLEVPGSGCLGRGAAAGDNIPHYCINFVLDNE